MKIKNLFIILFLSLVLFITGCNDANNESKKFVNIFADETMVRVGETLEISCSSNIGGDFKWSVDDTDVAKIDQNGYLTGISFGEVVVTVTSIDDPSCKDSITIMVEDGVVNNVKVVGVTTGIEGETLSLKYNLEPKGVTSKYIVESKNPDIATVNKDNSITLNKKGIAIIQIKIQDEGSYVHEFEVGCFDYTRILVDDSLQYAKLAKGAEINYDGYTYYNGYTALSSIKKAVQELRSGTIIVKNAIYDEDFIINKSNVELKGVDNPEINGSIVISSKVTDVTINGFDIKNDSGILMYGDNSNIYIINNNFENNTSDVTWKEQLNNSVIKLYSSTSGGTNNIVISNNTFKDLNDPAILFNAINSYKITDNKFKNCNTDCIRINECQPSKSGQWLIKNNTFENCYNVLYTRHFGSSLVSYDTIISIFDNQFNNISKNVISLNGNNGGTISLDVRYNYFGKVNNYIYLDTDTDKEYLHAYINYNNFDISSCEYLVKTSNEEKNSIDFSNNYVNSSIELTNKLSPNVISSNLSSSVDLNNSNKIYGKTSLYVNQETSFICSEANKFTSSNTSVVTITDSGVVNPLKTGSSKITAYKDNAVLGTFDCIVNESLMVNYGAKLVETALSQEGYVEGNNNYTKYGVWYSEQVNDSSFAYGAWCAMFVSWCADQSDIPRTIIPLYALCSAGKNWFESRGRFFYKENYQPVMGDVIFFLSDGAGHTGIVISSDSNKVYTIEGNTSNMCAKRSYSLDWHTITGYGHPDYPPYDGNQKVEFDVSGATDGSGASTH